MAKVKFTAVVADMRGKLAGTVFSKNRGGAYVRTKVTPVNPQTSFQASVRARLTQLSQDFRSLTAAQIAAWNSAVQSFSSTDVFGDIKNPSGINLYTKLNLNLLNAGQSVISTPPLPGAVDGVPVSGITVDSSPSTLDIASSLAAVPAGHTMIVEATAPQSPGKSFVKSEYRVVATVAAATAFPYSAQAAYVAKFGALVAGQKVFVRVKTVNNTTGQASQYSSASAITA